MERRSSLAVVVVAFLAVWLVACSSKSGAGSGTSSSPTPTPTGPLTGYVLTSAEASSAGPHVEERLSLNGQGLADLTLAGTCNSQTFPSEQKRADRLQVDYIDPQQKALVDSNEFVKYESGGGAQAYAELKAAVAHCPKTMTQTNNDKLSNVTVVTNVPAGLSANTVILSMTNTQHAGPVVGQVFIFQFDGDYFDGLYVFRLNVADALHDAAALGKLAAAHLKAAAG